jgi:hypothetical protein
MANENDLELRDPREPDELEQQDAAELPDREAMSLLSPGFVGEPALPPVHDKQIFIDDPKPTT